MQPNDRELLEYVGFFLLFMSIVGGSIFGYYLNESKYYIASLFFGISLCLVAAGIFLLNKGMT